MKVFLTSEIFLYVLVRGISNIEYDPIMFLNLQRECVASRRAQRVDAAHGETVYAIRQFFYFRSFFLFSQRSQLMLAP